LWWLEGGKKTLVAKEYTGSISPSQPTNLSLSVLPKNEDPFQPTGGRVFLAPKPQNNSSID